MHVLSYLYLLVLACFCHKVLSDSSEENSNNNPDKTIETTNNCSCVVYYLCDENNFIITDGRNILDERFGKGKEKNGSRVVKIPCSVDGYVCCKLKPSTTPDKPVVTSEQPEITTQPDFVSERAVAADKNKTRPGCGQQKTVLSVRVSVPAGDVSTTLPGEFPWMVAIFQKKSSPPNKYKFKCAGSLIHPKAVLTGTHCVVGTREGALKVIVNGESGFQDVDDNSKNVRAVSKTIKHPEYYSGGLYNDIALLVLEEPFNFAEGPINSVCIPKSDQIFDGKQCTATGWGANSQQADVPLKKVDLPIVDFDRCESLLRKTRLGNHFTLHPSFLCAGGEAGKDTCNGDGGGPLVCKNENNVYFQAGIVSWGINCAQKDIAGVYTDVAKFRKWIDEELKKYSIEIV